MPVPKRKLASAAMVVASRAFLQRLADPAESRHLSMELRVAARTMLRHYPSAEELKAIVEKGMDLTLEPGPGAQESQQ